VPKALPPTLRKGGEISSYPLSLVYKIFKNTLTKIAKKINNVKEVRQKREWKI
jgi:hypothetical protein